jgi:hypothetical protein
MLQKQSEYVILVFEESDHFARKLRIYTQSLLIGLPRWASKAAITFDKFRDLNVNLFEKEF